MRPAILVASADALQVRLPELLRKLCAASICSLVQVNVEEGRTSFLHFMTNVCAIVGGVFTVSGILDSTLYHGQKLIRKKMEIGKFG